MGNKSFVLPVQKPRVVPDAVEWGNLKNRFSGKTLFRTRLYYLETDDLSVLDSVNNKWFYEELFAYSRTYRDINLLPALKKIAGSERYDESLRQHASEVVEIIEEHSARDKNQQNSTPSTDEPGRADNARRILSGTRSPQTTEILRLLRDKSPELKRIALFLIGKFRMTDMLQEVCECLGVLGVEDDAFSVLQSFGTAAVKEVDRYFLKVSGNAGSGKILLRLMSKIHPPADMSFLADRLSLNSRLIRETALMTLENMAYVVRESEKERLKKIIYETFGTLTWIIASQISLKNGNNDFLLGEMNKEYDRWKDYLLRLMHLVYGDKAEEAAEKNSGEKENFIKPIPELAGLIFSGSTDIDDNKKRLKKLRHYFPVEVPEYGSVLEDLINCDYNLIGVWTKACTVRSIPEINEEDLGESVVALLFSPDQILREESAKLIARSGRELYKATSERIPEAVRNKLDGIVAGEITEKELVYEKVRFLSSLFKGINEDELLFLADKLAFARNDQRGLYSQPSGTIMWSFSAENSEPEIFVNQEYITDPGRIARDIRTACYYCYVLPLTTVSEFNFQHPESSFGIFEYIDKFEE